MFIGLNLVLTLTKHGLNLLKLKFILMNTNVGGSDQGEDYIYIYL